MGFAMRWKFLLIKFQPSVWWWAPVVLLKALALNLTTAFFSQGIFQLRWLFLVFIVYFIGVSSFQSWRSTEATYVDLAMHAVLIAVVFLCTGVVNVKEWPEEDHTNWLFALVLLPLAFVLIATVVLVRDMICPETDEQRQKKAEAFCDILRKVNDEVQLTLMLDALTDYDHRCISEAMTIIEVEMMKTGSTAGYGRLKSIVWDDEEQDAGQGEAKEGAKPDAAVAEKPRAAVEDVEMDMDMDDMPEDNTPGGDIQHMAASNKAR